MIFEHFRRTFAWLTVRYESRPLDQTYTRHISSRSESSGTALNITRIIQVHITCQYWCVEVVMVPSSSVARDAAVPHVQKVSGDVDVSSRINLEQCSQSGIHRWGCGG